MFHRILFFSLLLSFLFVNGQEEDLFRSLRAETQPDESLLPDRMIFTQSLLWGERGLIRKTGLSPLNTVQREKELSCDGKC